MPIHKPNQKSSISEQFFFLSLFVLTGFTNLRRPFHSSTLFLCLFFGLQSVSLSTVQYSRTGNFHERMWIRLKEQYPVTAHAPNFDFWTGCREIKRCGE